MTTKASEVPPRTQPPADLAAIAEGAADQTPPSVTVTVGKDDPRFWPIVRAILFVDPGSSPAAGGAGNPQGEGFTPFTSPGAGVPCSRRAVVGGEAPGSGEPGAAPTKRKRRRNHRPGRGKQARRRARYLSILRRRVRAMQGEIRRLKRG